MPKIPSYHYVTHRDTEEQAYRINEGKFSGIVWLYENVKFPIYNDLGEMVSPEDADKIPLTFDIDVLYNPTDKDLTDEEWEYYDSQAKGFEKDFTWATDNKANVNLGNLKDSIR